MTLPIIEIHIWQYVVGRLLCGCKPKAQFYFFYREILVLDFQDSYIAWTASVGSVWGLILITSAVAKPAVKFSVGAHQSIF